MKVGLIGCGVASEMHISAISKVRGAKVIGVADLDEGNLTEFGERYGIDARFKHYEEMIEQVKPTVVHVLTPPTTHAAITKEVLARGCAVLVEKPMCMDETEADSMIEAARNNDKPLCVMHNHLFDPVIQKADHLINLNPGNDPFLVRITYFIERHKLEEEGNLDPSHWINRLPLGVYGEHGAPHVLYLLLKWLKRASEIDVNDMNVSASRDADVQLWNATISSGSCMGVINLGTNTTVGQFVVEIFTPLMVIRLNMLDLTWTIYRERMSSITAGRIVANFEESLRQLWSSARNITAIATGRLKRRPGHLGLIRAFYDSIRDEQPPPVPPEDGREVVRILKVIEDKLKAKRVNELGQQIAEVPVDTYLRGN